MAGAEPIVAGFGPYRGVGRTRREIGRAELVLHIVEAHGETAKDRAVADTILAGVALMRVFNKIDAIDVAPARPGDEIALLAKTGAGVDLLRAELLHRAGLDGAGSSSLSVTLRWPSRPRKSSLLRPTRRWN